MRKKIYLIIEVRDLNQRLAGGLRRGCKAVASNFSLIYGLSRASENKFRSNRARLIERDSRKRLSLGVGVSGRVSQCSHDLAGVHVVLEHDFLGLAEGLLKLVRLWVLEEFVHEAHAPVRLQALQLRQLFVELGDALDLEAGKAFLRSLFRESVIHALISGRSRCFLVFEG